MNSDSHQLLRTASAVCAGDIPLAWVTPDCCSTHPPAETPAGILPGSFNPLHAGHRALRDAAEQHLGGTVCFELTIANADKPPLEPEEAFARSRQFSGKRDLLAITSAATFVEKARLFPGATFIVGVDTAERILEVRFYGVREAAMTAALFEIRAAGSRFLVAGRVLGGSFTTLSDLEIPAEFANLFIELPEAKFRADVASSELRGDDSF